MFSFLLFVVFELIFVCLFVPLFWQIIGLCLLFPIRIISWQVQGFGAVLAKYGCFKEMPVNMIEVSEECLRSLIAQTLYFEH